jgi:hypothetical protein
MESIVTGLNALKDKFRLAKLKCGDLRGLKNRFSLSEKLGVATLQTYFYSTGGNGDTRAELTADCYSVESDRCIHEYTMGGLIEEMKGETELYEVHLICLMWDKERTDAERKDIDTFLYKNK